MISRVVQAFRRYFLGTVLISLVGSFAGCGGGYGNQSSTPVPRSLSVRPSTAVQSVGETRQFSAQVTFSDSTTRDVTSQAIWISSSDSIATITQSGGLGSAIAPGDVTVSATFTAAGSSVTASALLHVAASSPVQSIEILPVTNPLELGASQQFTATATRQDGSTEDVTQRAAWRSSDPAVLRINVDAGRIGLANTRGPGSATISAVAEGITGSTPVIVVRRISKFLYVAGPFGIDGYAVSPTDGSLTSVRGARFASAGEISSLAITRDRKFLYATDHAVGAIWAFKIDGSGELIPISNSPFSTTANSSPVSLSAHPAADLLFMTNFDTGEITAFAIAADGSISPRTPVSFVGSQPLSSATTPDGKNLYQAVQDGGSATIASFSILSNGKIDPVPGGRTIIGPSPKMLTAEPFGHYLYAAVASSSDDPSESVFGFQIDPRSGLLTPVEGSPFDAGVNPIATAIDASGRFVYVMNSVQSKDDVSVFSIDSSSGVLSPIPGTSVSVASLPQSLAIDPGARFVYVGLSGTQGIRGFKIDETTGALSELSTSPFVARGDIMAMVFTY